MPRNYPTADYRSVNWTKEQLDEIRVMEAQGRRTAEMAAAFGVSIDKINGVRHRLGFSRPSAIQHQQATQQPHTRRIPPGASTLPPLPSDSLPLIAIEPSPRRTEDHLIPCSWVLSREGRPVVYCDEICMPSKPYCSTHCAMAYLRKADAEGTAV